MRESDTSVKQHDNITTLDYQFIMDALENKFGYKNSKNRHGFPCLAHLSFTPHVLSFWSLITLMCSPFLCLVLCLIKTKV